MGYSTNLYAVDLDALRAAVGSKDEKLVKKIIRKCFGDIDERPRGRNIRVEVVADGGILLDGQPAGLTALKEAIEVLTGKGDEVRYRPANFEAGRPIFAAIVETVKAMNAAGLPMPGIECYAPGQAWVEESPGEDSREEREHVRRLVFGEHRRADPSDLAYALEYLCRVIGKDLDPDDTLGPLDVLGLDSPLLRWRMPVKIPAPGDFPYVSYLTAKEVAAEAARLQAIDLSSDDEDVEEARKTLLRCLKSASRKKSAVVAFYY